MLVIKNAKKIQHRYNISTSSFAMQMQKHVPAQRWNLADLLVDGAERLNRAFPPPTAPRRQRGRFPQNLSTRSQYLRGGINNKCTWFKQTESTRGAHGSRCCVRAISKFHNLISALIMTKTMFYNWKQILQTQIRLPLQKNTYYNYNRQATTLLEELIYV